MKKVSILQVYDHICFEDCFNLLNEFVDEIYIRIDNERTSQHTLEVLKSCKKVRKIIEGNYSRKIYKWREELLRLLDDIKPDLVFSLDVDEKFEDPVCIKKEVDDFWESDKDAIMFHKFPCPVINVTEITMFYPATPHMKIFKWKEGLSYFPYGGRCRINNYRSIKCHWLTDSRMLHYAFYTKEMRDRKYQEFEKSKCYALMGAMKDINLRIKIHERERTT